MCVVNVIKSYVIVAATDRHNNRRGHGMGCHVTVPNNVVTCPNTENTFFFHEIARHSTLVDIGGGDI